MSENGVRAQTTESPQQLGPEQIIHNSFKAAAVSITQMYKESQKLKDQYLIEGYEQCLNDIWAYATAVSEKHNMNGEDVNHSAFNGQNRISVEVTDLLTALSRRIPFNDKYRHNPSTQVSDFVDINSTEDCMGVSNHNLDIKSQIYEFQTKKRKASSQSTDYHTTQQGPAQFSKPNRQFAFISNRNISQCNESPLRKFKTDGRYSYM